MGVRTVIIALGSKGALIFDGQTHQYIEPFKKVAIDTTGAGDAFNGALCACLAKGQTTSQAATYAAAFASLPLSAKGQPTCHLINKFYNE
ncbi:pfkB family carbohydrate kinase [Orbus hercynius]|uniref:PfkB family carbohydrate kinase n=1 Tax=Orbus hercynius TaxID=593135 RepID=A0A495RF02_9GAMM|nr:pfkB family carbohydrate kinase [Orbus hercynius]